jgi:UDP-glucose 4-epimerase
MVRRQIVAVTGAAGFIGQHLCSALLHDGAEVRALIRTRGSAPEGAREFVVTGLTDDDALAVALAGADAVVHLAARVHVMHDTSNDPLAAFRDVNVAGTVGVLEAAARAGVRRAVSISSVKAVGESNENDDVWSERTAAAPVDPYGISKREGEQEALRIGRAHGMRVTVLRLPLVYGPGMRANMLRLFDLVARGAILPLGGIRNRRSIAYVGNVVAAIMSALQDGSASEGVFFVADERALSSPDLVRAIAHALGVRPRLVPVPEAVFRAAGRVGDVIARAVRWPLTSREVARLLESLEVDASALARAVGNRPPYTTEEGLQQTAAWYRALRRQGQPAPRA